MLMIIWLKFTFLLSKAFWICLFFLFSFRYFTMGLLAFQLAQLIQIIPDKARSVEWRQAETLSGYNYLTPHWAKKDQDLSPEDKGQRELNCTTYFSKENIHNWVGDETNEKGRQKGGPKHSSFPPFLHAFFQ